MSAILFDFCNELVNLDFRLVSLGLVLWALLALVSLASACLESQRVADKQGTLPLWRPRIFLHERVVGALENSTVLSRTGQNSCLLPPSGCQHCLLSNACMH